MKAIIKLDVPEWQIGEEVFVYFPDTMCKKAICELDTSSKTPIWCDERFSKNMVRILGYLYPRGMTTNTNKYTCFP